MNGYATVVLDKNTLGNLYAAIKVYKLSICEQDVESIRIAYQHAYDMEQLDNNAVKLSLKSLKYIQ